jgi:signal transduction histidine kinase
VSTGEYRNPASFISANGARFARDLERITAMPVQLYGPDGTPSDASEPPASNTLGTALSHALDGKVAYVTLPDRIIYFAPLTVREQPVGVVRFTYSRAQDNEFYSQLRNQLIAIGAGVFLVAAVIGYAYFSRVARSIRTLNKSVHAIEAGHYVVPALSRRDEIGDLSRGIGAMAQQIRETLADNEAERHKLALAVDELHRLDTQQKELLGAVSHEFKTPLTSIRAYLDLVEMYPDDVELAQRLRDATDSETRRLYEMVEKVLRLTEVEKYDFEAELAPIDVREIIRDIAGSLSGKAQKSGLTLTYTSEPQDGPVLVNADPDLLGIVVLNLIDNAIKYNETSGSITLDVRAMRSEVTVDVGNTGRSIPSDQHERIFDPFTTVDKSLSRATGGSGLGLAVARKYAERMGGTLVLARSDNSGSTFRLTLPASPR